MEEKKNEKKEDGTGMWHVWRRKMKKKRMAQACGTYGGEEK